MATIQVFVKHQGQKYEVELDPTTNGETFKLQLYSLTGVEPERQKILVKGGQLKDETELSKLGAKPGQTYMMMGTPSTDPSAMGLLKPSSTIKFMEDMTDAEAARAEGAIPAGLQNLGNTCYMNSTLQTLRAVPELQEQLSKYKGTPIGDTANADIAALGFDPSDFGLRGVGNATADLTGALRDLYRQMSQTQQGFPPMVFLHALQTVFPQFAEKAKSGHGYAQQDAEEAWTQIISQLRSRLKIDDQTEGSGKALQTPSISFVDKYFAGRFSSRLALEAPDASSEGTSAEEPTLGADDFLKLDCHIETTTNHLRDGILAGLTEKIEKRSTSLERDAVYLKTSRISRLPRYLTVHFVRFFWKKEIKKKAKIMRKVTFPAELDVTEFCTASLRQKLVPVRDKIREIRKDEEDMSRARKRTKLAHKQEMDRAHDKNNAKGKAVSAEAKNDAHASSSEKPLKIEHETHVGNTKDGMKSKTAASEKEKEEQGIENFKTDAEYEAERAATLLKAKQHLLSLVDGDLASDVGCNPTGLYELRGVVTHQGASADSGHYTSYVKKEGALDEKGHRKEEDGKWWWFNDDKVSEVEADKIEGLSGGGESHSALILLYRAFDVPKAEDIASVKEKQSDTPL